MLHRHSLKGLLEEAGDLATCFLGVIDGHLPRLFGSLADLYKDLSLDTAASHPKINGLRVRSTCRAEPGVTPCYNREFMTEFVLALLVALRVFFRTRHDTALEILALRHQVAVLKRKRPRPPLNSVDRLFWATLRRTWSSWA